MSFTRIEVGGIVLQRSDLGLVIHVAAVKRTSPQVCAIPREYLDDFDAALRQLDAWRNAALDR